MAWHPRCNIPSSSPSAVSWASCTRQGLCAQQMNGHFASSLHFWPGRCSIPRLKSISLELELSILTRDSRICLLTDSVCRGLFVASSAARALLPPPVCLHCITDDLMLVIWRSLELNHPDHVMFWAACSLGYFGFLHASKFTVPNLSSFSASFHDIAVDSSSSPSSMRIQIKGSKNDLFRKGCFVQIGLGRHPLCAMDTSSLLRDFGPPLTF